LPDAPAKMIGFSRESIKNLAVLSLFLVFLPTHYIQEVILVETNKVIVADGGKAMDFGELLVWLGCWFFMATTKGFSRKDFWSMSEIDPFCTAPMRFNTYMSKRRFEDILKCLRFTNSEPPPYRDRFHFIRQLIDRWNDNMSNVFKSSWVSCLDESMSSWSNKKVDLFWLDVRASQASSDGQ
jgi:hypothetical protein